MNFIVYFTFLAMNGCNYADAVLNNNLLAYSAILNYLWYIYIYFSDDFKRKKEDYFSRMQDENARRPE